MAEFEIQIIRLLADGLPGNVPSDRLRCSRLQLRGSAGIAPASLSSPQGKDAQTEGHFKERKNVMSEIYRGDAVEVNRRPGLVAKASLRIRLTIRPVTDRFWLLSAMEISQPRLLSSAERRFIDTSEPARTGE